MGIIPSCRRVIIMYNGFWGWYFKCQSDSHTLAVIPAVHSEKNKKSCSIQLITNSYSQNICFPYAAYRKGKDCVEIADNRFGKHGIWLNLHTLELTATGSVSFENITPIKYDIMGPFAFVPFMECRHSVMSMMHDVTGEININGKPYVFRKASGYWEGDRGRSFPKEYIWTQCNFEKGSIMLSVADIPIGRRRFTGVIGVVLLNGKEYRIATYLGAKTLRIYNGEVIVRQGDMYLRVKCLENTAHPLCAPQTGAMNRTIHENPSCRVYYKFEQNDTTHFEFEATNAAFEYEYPY